YPLDTSMRLLYQSHFNKHAVRPPWAGRDLQIPLVLMASQSFFRADEVPLSRLAATTLIEENITGYTWHWRRNENVRGDQLAVGTMVADLGIGMHSHCQLAFDLPDGAMSFSTWVGIDEAVGSGGCVRCRVFLDEVAGEPAWSSGLLQGVDEPAAVNIPDLQGAKRLILVAEFADEDHPPDSDPFDLRDEVAWLFPTVVVRSAN
ncbi:MAG TPA: NPCBM/NEW2 domain-containing protein, partial [Thermoguttaceae bacterium]|nr:NPCBM/NEW2 domain-containing protein [Thermoguttaceae bacterium]